MRLDEFLRLVDKKRSFHEAQRIQDYDLPEDYDKNSFYQNYQLRQEVKKIRKNIYQNSRWLEDD